MKFKKITVGALLLCFLIGCLQFKVKAVYELSIHDFNNAVAYVKKNFPIIEFKKGEGLSQARKKVRLEGCLAVAKILKNILMKINNGEIFGMQELLSNLREFKAVKKRLENVGNVADAIEWIKQFIKLYEEEVYEHFKSEP